MTVTLTIFIETIKSDNDRFIFFVKIIQITATYNSVY